MPMKLNRSPRAALISFSLFILFALIGSDYLIANARPKHQRGRAAAGRGRAASRKVARGGKLSRRERREVARAGRRGGRVRLSKREMRAENARLAREQSAYIAKLQKRSGRKLSKR